MFFREFCYDGHKGIGADVGAEGSRGIGAGGQSWAEGQRGWGQRGRGAEGQRGRGARIPPSEIVSTNSRGGGGNAT